MNSETAWNMFVFRDGRRTVDGGTLARDLACAIRDVYTSSLSKEERLSDALLRSGELECALADVGYTYKNGLPNITDALSDALLGRSQVGHEDLLAMLPENVPAELRISPPEGFTYYALHPLDFADLARDIPLSSEKACVIGIRSIGATLSALVAASLRDRRTETTRITVRPNGHPYDRQTQFTPQQTLLIQGLASCKAEFVIVDEGPGMSGSSFLSVGEALVAAGVSRQQISFLCSRTPDPDTLRAEKGGERWRSFRSYYAKKNSRLPHEAKLYVGGGEWREFFSGSRKYWPASWTQMERLKFLSPDRKSLFKFEGFGRFGGTVVQRGTKIADAGFGPQPTEFSRGFATYPVMDGRSATREDLNLSNLTRMAAYLAFRVKEFPDDSYTSSEQLETMVRFNCTEEFGVEPGLPEGALSSSCPVIVDGRMMPHEFVFNGNEMYKVDGASHGDDHFFPGPTDITWDLAGVIVEWEMGSSASDLLVGEYERLTRDNHVRSRLPAFELAYSVFRMSYCKMAAAAMRGSEEEVRLLECYMHFRELSRNRLANFAAETLAS